jgi:hypothetical protein
VRFHLLSLTNPNRKEYSKMNPGSASNTMIYSGCYGLVVFRVHIQ